MDAHLAFRFLPADMPDTEEGRGLRLQLGVCGSVAAYRALDLLRQWQDAGFSVGVTLTPSAQRFVTPLPFEALGAAPVYTSLFEDPRASSPFAHLEPGQTCRAFIVAPASAATLERLARGAADELLSCQALAFRGPLVVAPAMNPAMWEHPATQHNVDVLRSRGVLIVPPGVGRTACGDLGQGRLADVRHIYLAGLRAALPQDLAGMRALVTLGPTREAWDGVRFWSNASTGTMGASLALALWLRGAEVHAVCGPGAVWLPAENAIEGVAPLHRHNVASAREMFDVSMSLWSQMDMGLFTAAVADYSPESRGAAKFKKSEAPEGFSLRFVPNPDILRTLAAKRRESSPQKIMGFAAESGDLAAAVQGKLLSKRADMVVGNLLGDGFGTASNTVHVADRHGRTADWSQLPKPVLAWRLVSWLASL